MERKRKRSTEEPKLISSTQKSSQESSAKLLKSPPIRRRKRKKACASIQTEDEFQFLFSDDALISQSQSEELPESYWKKLAETRREALSEALEINLKLTQRVAELEEDNRHLEEIVTEAKKIAQLIANAENSNSESGIENENEEG